MGHIDKQMWSASLRATLLVSMDNKSVGGY